MGFPQILVQTPLPEEYQELSDEELDRRIARAKETLGRSLVILGHNYQRDEVIKFADYRGDSLKLARWAAEQREARYIVFCGVHFMAETAEILTSPEQAVILPDLGAGCSMADMASPDLVEECWQILEEMYPGEVVPVSYINSSAALKAFVGERGGAICTSSNARAVLEWAFGQKPRVLFFPDEHLGRNTGRKMGLGWEEMAVWQREEARLIPGWRPPGVEAGFDPRKVRLFLWNGYCSVHQRFRPDQVRRARERYPGIKVIVHPECRHEVVEMADLVGSTEFISRTISSAPPGSKWAVGTEINLVSRLAQENPDKLVITLDDIVCPCMTMYRISPQHLLWALENLVQGRVVNRIEVPEETARWARVALERMLELK